MTVELLAAISRLLDDEPILTQLRQGGVGLSAQWVRESDGYFRAKDADVSSLLPLNERLPALDSFRECREMLSGDEVLGPCVGKMIGDALGVSRFDPDRFLIALLFDAIRDDDPYARAQELVVAAQSQVQDHSAPRRILAPLPSEFRFEMQEGMNFARGVSLRILSDEDIASVVNVGFRFRNIPNPPGLAFVGAGWGIEVTFELPLVVEEPGGFEHRSDAIDVATAITDAARRRVDSCLTAFRLLQAGPVSAVGVVELRDDPFLGGRSMSFNSLRYPRPPRDDYHLATSDTTRLAELFHQVESEGVAGNPSLKTALSRFSSSIIRHDAEDRLLDLVIASEAVFSGEGNAGDLSLRVAQRFARFLEGTDDTSVLDLYRHMRAAYTGRSKLVHAAKRTKGVERKIAEAISALDETERRIRRVLVMALAITAEHGSFAPNWDQLVLEGRVPKA